VAEDTVAVFGSEFPIVSEAVGLREKIVDLYSGEA
jgi:hypothetical protein